MGTNSGYLVKGIILGACEKCGGKGRLISWNYITGAEKNTFLCFDCYLSLDKQKGFFRSESNIYPICEIEASRTYHMAKFFGKQLVYCPFQRLNDKKLNINQEHWDTFEQKESERLANETMPKDW